MTPDQLISELSKRGVDISVRTSQRWVKEGLMSVPERGSYGQGKGTWAKYPTAAISEALTVHLFKTVYKLINSEISKARKAYLAGKVEYFSNPYGLYFEKLEQGADFKELLKEAKKEAEGVTNAEHALLYFRSLGAPTESADDLKEMFLNPKNFFRDNKNK